MLGALMDTWPLIALVGAFCIYAWVTDAKEREKENQRRRIAREAERTEKLQAIKATAVRKDQEFARKFGSAR